MNTLNIGQRYFNWLCKKVCDRKSVKAFSKVLYTLYVSEFTAILDRDNDRISDGLRLRRDFLDDEDIDRSLEGSLFFGKPCSILELMVALACRCERDLMTNADIGDRTSKWFWVMMHNLGLDGMTDNTFDAEQVEYILYTFINRQYDYTGFGGLFTVQNPRRDMREVDIWYQMCWYLSESY